MISFISNFASAGESINCEDGDIDYKKWQKTIYQLRSTEKIIGFPVKKVTDSAGRTFLCIKKKESVSKIREKDIVLISPLRESVELDEYGYSVINLLSIITIPNIDLKYTYQHVNPTLGRSVEYGNEINLGIWFQSPRLTSPGSNLFFELELGFGNYAAKKREIEENQINSYDEYFGAFNIHYRFLHLDSFHFFISVGAGSFYEDVKYQRVHITDLTTSFKSGILGKLRILNKIFLGIFFGARVDLDPKVFDYRYLGSVFISYGF